MSFFSPLLEKPWEQNRPILPQSSDREHTRRAGLRLLLIVVSVLFFLFIVAFLIRSQYPDWQPLAEEPSNPLFDPRTLWLNSAYLALASICMQWAKIKARKTNQASFPLGLGLAGLFSIAFVAGQILFWQQLSQRGFMVNSNPALSFFYLLTGLHAVHVGIGLLMWMLASWAAIAHSPKLSHYVDLCAIYWHFLLALWVVLFALLMSKPETYDAIVAFCGLG